LGVLALLVGVFAKGVPNAAIKASDNIFILLFHDDKVGKPAFRQFTFEELSLTGRAVIPPTWISLVMVITKSSGRCELHEGSIV